MKKYLVIDKTTNVKTKKAHICVRDSYRDYKKAKERKDYLTDIYSTANHMENITYIDEFYIAVIVE